MSCNICTISEYAGSGIGTFYCTMANLITCNPWLVVGILVILTYLGMFGPKDPRELIAESSQ